VVLLGEAATGKTSLAVRFAKGLFSEYSESTIGAAFLTKTLVLDTGESYRLEIWDTAGQERFNSLAPMYYRAAKICIVCYDITSRDSYMRAIDWVDELHRDGPGPSCVIALAGLKADLASKREVPEQEARTFALDHGVQVFAETSAKTEFGVEKLFELALRRLPNETPLSAPAPATDISQGILNNEAESGRCCSSS